MTEAKDKPGRTTVTPAQTTEVVTRAAVGGFTGLVGKRNPGRIKVTKAMALGEPPKETDEDEDTPDPDLTPEDPPKTADS